MCAARLSRLPPGRYYSGGDSQARSRCGGRRQVRLPLHPRPPPDRCPPLPLRLRRRRRPPRPPCCPSAPQPCSAPWTAAARRPTPRCRPGRGGCRSLRLPSGRCSRSRCRCCGRRRTLGETRTGAGAASRQVVRRRGWVRGWVRLPRPPGLPAGLDEPPGPDKTEGRGTKREVNEMKQ